MKLAVFSAQPYDKQFLDETNTNKFAEHDIEIIYHSTPLSIETVALAQGCEAVCVFVNDSVDSSVLEELASNGTKAILLRCAGFNNVDLQTAEKLSLFVARVAAYSPEAVAEYAVTLMMTLNRHTHKAYNRVREGNFNLNGLIGFTMHGKTVGLVGTGKIGLCAARILKGFGCRLLAYDPFPSDAFREHGEYVSLERLLAESDVVSLHCPLMDATRHIVNAESIAQMRDGAMLVNTSRGGLIDTRAVVDALKARKLGAVGLDVYEQEGTLFYYDRSADIIDDDVFQRLMTFPNVIVSGHQGFFTKEALSEIAETTLRNVVDFKNGVRSKDGLVGSGPPRP